jgi:hypothetical protein
VPQRAAAAFFAISRFRSGVSLAARAFPPFFPPSRPRATAAGFFPSSGSALTSATIAAASAFTSRGFLLERFGINLLYHEEVGP